MMNNTIKNWVATETHTHTHTHHPPTSPKSCMIIVFLFCMFEVIAKMIVKTASIFLITICVLGPWKKAYKTLITYGFSVV